MADERFVPIERYTVKADATQAIANKVVFIVPYKPAGYIAQVLAPTTGVENATGFNVTYALNATTKNHEVTVAVTSLTADSLVNLICW